MAYRYTNTDKWNDSWFVNLKPNEKLLFIYLYENCDIAGFIEINPKIWSSFTGLDKRAIEGALKGLQRGLIYSIANDCIYLKTFLKHQKNLPLNPEKNMAHRGIIKRFDAYKNKFEIVDTSQFIEGALKGLQSPYGNGNGIGNKGGVGEKKLTPEETSINFYIEQVNKAKEFTDAMSQNYINLCRHICQKNEDGTYRMSYLLKVKKQLSLDDFSKLYKKANGNLDSIMSKVDSFQTNADYYKKYNDIYLSVNKWMIKDKNYHGHLNPAQ